jgi:hypothetical protein
VVGWTDPERDPAVGSGRCCSVTTIPIGRLVYAGRDEPANGLRVGRDALGEAEIRDLLRQVRGEPDQASRFQGTGQGSCDTNDSAFPG